MGLQATILLNVSPSNDLLKKILFSKINEVTVIEKVYENIMGIFGEAHIVGGGDLFDEVIEFLGIEGVRDEYEEPYFLSNLALAIRRFGNIFVFSPNMPCINKKFVEVLVRIWRTGGYLIVAPGWQDNSVVYGQAVYSKDLIQDIEQLIRAKKSIHDLYALYPDKTYVLYLDRLPLTYTSSTVILNDEEELQMFRKLVNINDSIEYTCKEMFKELYLRRSREASFSS